MYTFFLLGVSDPLTEVSSKRDVFLAFFLETLIQTRSSCWSTEESVKGRCQIEIEIKILAGILCN